MSAASFKTGTTMETNGVSAFVGTGERYSRIVPGKQRVSPVDPAHIRATIPSPLSGLPGVRSAFGLARKAAPAPRAVKTHPYVNAGFACEVVPRLQGR